jgi:hypothetical protein
MRRPSRRKASGLDFPPDVLEALRSAFGGLSPEALQRIPPDHLEDFVSGIAAITIRRRQHPDTVGLSVSPDAIPVTLNMAKLLRWKKDAERGKPVPHTVEFLGPEGKVIGRESASRPIVRSSAPPKRSGRPRKLTLEQYAEHRRQRQEDLTDAQRARILGVSRTVVLRLRHRYERRKNL